MKKIDIYRIVIGLCLLMLGKTAGAQEYSGITGMVHVPTAEMAPEGEARIGVFFLNREFTPDNLKCEGAKYHTADYFLAITPFPWIELSYTCTLMKDISNAGEVGYNMKDRYFSIKVRPLKEGKWWPAIAIGANDPIGTVGGKGTTHEGEAPSNGDGKSQYFCNFYVAATKHFQSKAGEWGVHASYRKFKREYNHKWNGLVGGITYRPAFARNWRAIAEYTGNDINVGIDCVLWKHLLLQGSMQNGKYFSGGICFQIQLL